MTLTGASRGTQIKYKLPENNPEIENPRLIDWQDCSEKEAKKLFLEMLIRHDYEVGEEIREKYDIDSEGEAAR